MLFRTRNLQILFFGMHAVAGKCEDNEWKQIGGLSTAQEYLPVFLF